MTNQKILSQLHKIIISPQNEGARVDFFLASQTGISSRSFAQKILKEKLVFINGKQAKASTKLLSKDLLEYQLPAVKKSYLEPEHINLDILYEDKHLLVINKPRGLVVHPGAGHQTGTLTQALLNHCGHLSVIGGVERPGIVHRLDKGTSGVMVVAKNDISHIALAAQFKNHTITKKYLALVQGKISPLNHKIQNYLVRHEKNRKKYRVDSYKGKEAISSYRVLKQNNLASLVEVEILTGRTHQIRVHLSHKGYPLWGDSTYGAKQAGSKWSAEVRAMVVEIKEPLLHAHSLTFKHPVSGKVLSFTVAPPSVFTEAQKVLFS